MNPLTHSDAADLVASLYGEAGAPPVDWLYRSPDDAPVMFAVVRVGNKLIVVSRGSKTLMDWVRDLIALARSPVVYPAFGKLHAGMWLGITDAWIILNQLIRIDDEVVFLGHSLGGAHAEFLAALMLVLLGRTPRVVTWGCPRPGYQQFTDFAAKIPGTAYSNFGRIGYDPVPDLPWTTKNYPYVSSRVDVQVTQMPSSSVILDIGPQFGWHHFENYRAVTPATVL